MTPSPPRIFGIAGWKNSGKTGLAVRLVETLVSRGFVVSTIKHAHHDFDIDKVGADSYRHRQAGAHEVTIVSGTRFAIMHELRGEPEPAFEDILSRLAPCDLVLIEGYKREPIPKIEARRLEALLLVGDPDHLYVISGNGDVIEPELPLAAIGSGGPYAQSAARALFEHTELPARQIVERALGIAADVCIYTNRNLTIEELSS